MLVGFTVAEPEVLFPVEKLLPEHEVALVELHESEALAPDAITLGVAVIDAVGVAVVVVVEQSPVV